VSTQSVAKTGVETKTAYIGLGANLGDRLEGLRRAKRLLAETPGVEITGCSSIYETLPVGVNGPPGNYLNAVVRVETGLSPRQLLGALRQAEQRLGRCRSRRWGPRTIDLDLLLVARDVIVEEGLVVPHPELIRRSFVLAPLLELSPALRHPVTGLPLVAYFELVGWGGVRRLEGLGW
jgi:2-amino-4-hydroxy-6-hydroxymethyldihydropteridine diphosphokinase